MPTPPNPSFQRTPDGAAELNRVCRAGLGARRCKSSLQAREAAGEGKRQGIGVRRWLKDAGSEAAGRRTGTREEA